MDQPLTLFGTAPPSSGLAVLHNYGLGVDSTAILARWLLEPASRDFDLADLVVVTAMTGDEWDSTGELVSDHILPLLAAHGVRYVQLGRGGYRLRDGVVVLDDSRVPTRLHLEGAYRLSEELLANAIVPMSAAGLRRCSAKQKGAVIEAALPGIVGDRPFRNVVGFASGEERRACRGEAYDYPGRTSEYPLIRWGWTRDHSAAYLAETFGAIWHKSACTYCPFAFHRGEGANEDVLARYLAEPRSAMLALKVEYGARCVNPTQTLTVGGALLDLLTVDGRFADVLARFESEIHTTEHALLRVRRVLGGRWRTWRSVRAEACGLRADMLVEASAAARAAGVPADVDAVTTRVWLRRRAQEPPYFEESLVVAPAWIADKQRPGFEAVWARATGQGALPNSAA